MEILKARLHEEDFFLQVGLERTLPSQICDITSAVGDRTASESEPAFRFVVPDMLTRKGANAVEEIVEKDLLVAIQNTKRPLDHNQGWHSHKEEKTFLKSVSSLIQERARTRKHEHEKPMKNSEIFISVQFDSGS